MKMIEKVLRHDLLREKPPVLLDIGAASRTNARWKLLARYSICFAFDPDSREMGYIQGVEDQYRRLYVVPAIVHPELDGECDFYLASSPECSSTLPLCSDEVKNWHFQYFFGLKEQVKLPCVTLNRVLAEAGLDYVDCYKSDTQGTDLRIFRSLKPEISGKILSLELEPGFPLAYRNDDTLGAVFDYMEKQTNFRLIDCRPLGSQYFPEMLERKYLSALQRRLIPTVHRACPLWMELTYLNHLESPDLTLREYLLGWVLAMMMEEYGWALDICERGTEKFPDPLFGEMKRSTLRAIPWLLPSARKIIRKLFHCE